MIISAKTNEDGKMIKEVINMRNSLNFLMLFPPHFWLLKILWFTVIENYRAGLIIL